MINVNPLAPLPPRKCPELGVVLATAARNLHKGEDVFDVVLSTAVHAWMAGHIEGEDGCWGCDARTDHSQDWEARQNEIRTSAPAALSFLKPETWHAATLHGLPDGAIPQP
ncbi:hypothetical protein [Streptomyces sp. NBC_01304]|uniref:hypothetical protein n=1 Tax=Streptomyces sp. NBC_01304 TaxID=2903818 RepID=UPI002E135741|nr:hypothetical protein OG430_33645 [Streptomyces sp. NBC_01304]